LVHLRVAVFCATINYRDWQVIALLQPALPSELGSSEIG
jgi:hypothetical protein